MLVISEIILSDGTKVLVSEVDYPFIVFFYDIKVDKSGYVVCTLKQKNMGLRSGKLHNIIIQERTIRGKYVIDHINSNKLDNRRENLRYCTHQENMMNRKIQEIYKGRKVTSSYKGVHWSEIDKAWITQIGDSGKVIKLGLFDSEIAAANCYNYHAERIQKEFANINSNIPFMDKSE